MGGLGPGFVRRVYPATLVVGVSSAILAGLYAGWPAGAALAAGVALALVNFRLLDLILSRLLRPQPLWGPKIAIALGLKLPLLLGALFLCFRVLHLSPFWFSLGFFLLFVVILLKVLGRVMIRAPRAGEASDRRGVGPRAVRSRGATPSPAAAGSRLEANRAARTEPVRGESAGRSLRASLDRSRSGGPDARKKAGTLGASVILLVAGGSLLASLVAGPGNPGGAAREAAWQRLGRLGVAGEAWASETGSDVSADLRVTEPLFAEARAEEEPEAEDFHTETHGPKEEDEGQFEFPNLVTYLNYFFPGQGWTRFLHHWENPFFAILVTLFLGLVTRKAYQRRDLVPGRLQNAVELGVETFYNFVVETLGPQGKRYVPFVGTLFFYIWFMNLFGMIPMGKSPTSVYNTTMALAICVFVYVQFVGITRLGPIKYLRHFAGDPEDLTGWCLVPLQFPLHIIGELAKPVSLSLRLFGNVMGEDVLLALFAGLGVSVLAWQPLPVGVPLQVPFMFLAMLASTIQALIFALLTTIYLFQVLPHEEHAEEHGVSSAAPTRAAAG